MYNKYKLIFINKINIMFMCKYININNTNLLLTYRDCLFIRCSDHRGTISIAFYMTNFLESE